MNEFFTIHINIRLTDSTKNKIQELLNKFPEDFNNVSDIVRVAVIKLHREKIPQSKLKNDFKTRLVKRLSYE